MSRRRNNYSDDSSDDEEDVRARKRRRESESIDIEDRLESLITRVGEKSSSSLESNLEGLASVLDNDLGNYKHKILKILCDCIVKMPEKLTVYTTLVGLLNAKNYSAGGEFVELLVRNLKEALKTGEWENARMMVRFLSDLVNCRVVTANSLMSMYNNMVEVTLEDNIPQVRSDWYVYTVLSSLPWIGQELLQKKEAELDSLLLTIENYLQKRQKIHVPALRVWSNSEPHPQEEYLDCLWAQIQNLRQQKWEEHQIVKPYLAFDGVLCDALQHAIPMIMPPSHREEATYPLPSVVFRMFDYTDVTEGFVLPGAHSIERYLIEEQLHRIIHHAHGEKRECSAALLRFTVKAKIPLNYMIVEVIFAQLFHLPRPLYLDLMYGSLLIELCKLQPGSMPQVLALATEMLYERLETMNTSCIERFVNWFSYHLSNFQFRWSWEDWNDCLQMDKEQPKPKFVRETLLKCMRLSYHQRVIEIIPEDFRVLLPQPPQPTFKFEKDTAGTQAGTAIAQKLMNAISTKCTPEEAVKILRDVPNPLTDDEDDGMSNVYNPLKIQVFVESLLFMAKKSFSHSFAAISKFHSVLKALGEGHDIKTAEEAQVCILNSLYELWRNHQQMIVVVVDKLLKTQIVECSAVANWVFSPGMSAEFTSFFVWEILHSTVKKMNKQVTRLQKEIEEMRDKIDAHDRKMKEGLDFDDDEMDVPSLEAIDREEEKLEEAQSSQKNLFLVIFQRFILILTEHLAQSESEMKDYNTPWYRSVIERLQQVFFLHHEQVYRYVNTLETLMFTSDIDPHILEIFQQFCALRS